MNFSSCGKQRTAMNASRPAYPPMPPANVGTSNALNP